MRALVLGALLALHAGCAHFALRPALSCARQHGPAWAEYRSSHFVVDTDLEPDGAAKLVRELEQTYRSFLDVSGWRFPGRGEPPGRMKLLVFERLTDYDRVAPPHSDGFFAPRAFDGVPLIVFSTDESSQDALMANRFQSIPSSTHSPPWRRVFLHELTHRMLRYYVPNAPLWLHEGLAEFYSTFFLSGGQSIVGAPPLRARLSREVAPFFALIDWERVAATPRQVNALYVGAWMLVHDVMQRHRAQLGEALVRMADGEKQTDAFAAAFGPRMAAELEAEYHDEIGHARVTVWKSPYAPASVATEVERRDLGDGEVHLLWADAMTPGSDAFKEQLALAEAHGGDFPELRFIRGVFEARNDRITSAEYDLRRAASARPDDERYRVALARLHEDQAIELHWTAAQMATLDPEMQWLDQHARSAEAFVLVAIHDVKSGRIADARVRAQRAVQIDPTNPAAWATYSAIAILQGDVDGALEYGERALHVTPEGVDASKLVAEVHKLRELRDLRARRMRGEGDD